MQSAPIIPDSAPFSEEQRAWLNGFLAGVFATTQPAVAADPPPSLKIAVLYATQSGTAEGLARKVAKDLKSRGHIASLASLEGYTPAALAEERYAILIASTYGDGDAPDSAGAFYEKLCVEHFPRYQDLTYAVLALGDSHYEHFCKFGADLDHKLASLGAVRLLDRVDCDVDLDEEFAGWKEALFARLTKLWPRARRAMGRLRHPRFRRRRGLGLQQRPEARRVCTGRLARRRARIRSLRRS